MASAADSKEPEEYNVVYVYNARKCDYPDALMEEKIVVFYIVGNKGNYQQF